MSEVRWEQPPPSGNDRYDWAAIGAQLVARPGEWAMVAVARNVGTSSQMAKKIRTSDYHPLAALGRFEAVARTVDGEPRVYARYIGGEPS